MEDLLGIAAKGSAADCGKTGGLAWGFENINESGFTLNTGSGNEAGTSIKASTAQAHCGSASLSIPFAATAGNHIIDPFLQNGIKPAADLTGKTVSCWVFLKADPPPAGAPAAQMCAVTKDGRYICDGYRGGLPLNQWFDLAVTYGANHKAQDITSLDIQILSPTKGNSGQTWNGTAYFDDIRISDKVASPASPR
jgi:hypothetical protein